MASVDAGTELDELVVATAEPGTVVLVAAVIDVVVLDVATVLVVAVLDVVTVLVVTVLVVTVLVVVVIAGTVIGTATATGAALQLAIVSDPQSLLSKLLIRPNSL